jgi:hypothetical protein
MNGDDRPSCASVLVDECDHFFCLGHSLGLLEDSGREQIGSFPPILFHEGPVLDHVKFLLQSAATGTAKKRSSTSFIIMASIGTINADRSVFNIAGGDQTNYSIYPPAAG